VVPDIILPSLWSESKDLGENSLDNPLAYDTIKSAKYDPVNEVAPYLPELRRRSIDRVATDKEFGYLREDIELFKKKQADKTESLNEKQRQKEKEELDAKQKARDKERLARVEPPEKIYELTLKDAAQPGLPAPVQKTNTLASKFSASNVGVHSAGASTNMAAAVGSSLSPNDSDPDADEPKPPALDPAMTETEHILVDYLSVLSKSNMFTAGQRFP
jgi:carboxyl-terminal processing protease